MRLVSLNQSFPLYLIGNALDHYDTALYGFLCPIMAPLFFPNSDPSVAVMFGLGIGLFSCLSRPLGALYFGHFMYKRSLNKAFPLSLIGVSIFTASIGCLPDYQAIGVLAPILLSVVRFFQGFFAEGENSLSGLYIFEVLPYCSHRRFSSYYQASSLLGIIVASFTATLVALSPCPETYWRIAFLIGLAPGILGMILRRAPLQLVHAAPPMHFSINFIIQRYYKVIFQIIMVSGFSYMTYALPFIFLNAFVPTINPSLSYTAMITTHTQLLIFDLLLFIFLGRRHANDKSPFKPMIISALALAVLIIPLFYTLTFGHLWMVTLVRLLIIAIGVTFAAPLQEWFFSQIPDQNRYFVVGCASTLGKEILGRSTPFLCWYLWNTTHLVYAPALYISFISISVAITLYLSKKQSYFK